MSLLIGEWAWLYAQTVAASLWAIFRRLLDASGTRFIYLGVILAAIAFRILAAPLLGVGLQVGSDMARSGFFREKKHEFGLRRIY